MRLNSPFWFEIYYRYNWKEEVKAKLPKKEEEKFFIKRTCACCGKIVTIIINKKGRILSGAKYWGDMSLNTGMWGYSTLRQDGSWVKTVTWYNEFRYTFKDILVRLLGMEKKAEYWECDPCYRIGAWRGCYNDTDYELKEAGKPPIKILDYVPANNFKLSGILQSDQSMDKWLEEFIDWIESREEYFGGGIEELDKDALPKKKGRKKRVKKRQKKKTKKSS